MTRLSLGGPYVNPYTTAPPASAPAPQYVAELTIDAPAEGAELKGPSTGVTVQVKGTWRIVSGNVSIDHVEVRFGPANGQKWKPATQVGVESAGVTWEVSEVVKTTGKLPIAARLIQKTKDQIGLTRYVSVVTLIDPSLDQPAQDTAPPFIGIEWPASESSMILDRSNRADLRVTGTAADVGSGLAKVEVTVDGVTTPATALEKNWSRWEAPVTILGSGPHVVQARAVDKQGLSMTAATTLEGVTEPATPPAIERLMIVERCRLSTFLGAYGAGRTVKTLSLLPGEKTTVAVKSYRRESTTATEASSILDSHTEEAQEEFETTLASEQATKTTADETFDWNVSGQANAVWGWGSASLTAGATGGTAASREELAKNVANAVDRHAARASSKRDVEVKASREMKREEGEETSSESHIENINVSRTLNFVFRQMNQEFITLLHLVDVRVGYIRGDLVPVAAGRSELRFTYQEATLSQLESLLEQVIVPARRADVRSEIIRVLGNVFDYEDEPHSMVEEHEPKGTDGKPIANNSYLRVPKGKTSTYVDPVTKTEFTVPGVILAAMKNVMPTDGVICDAVLGEGEALDSYSKGLQSQAIEARRIENARQGALAEKEKVAVQLVEKGDAKGAGIFKEVYPTPEAESLALVTSDRVSTRGDSQGETG
jgi:hypothetical protein